MNIYEVRHNGHYLGGLSVVVAETEEQAIELTKAAVVPHGLKPDNVRVVRRLKTDAPYCYVLDDGDYWGKLPIYRIVVTTLQEFGPVTVVGGSCLSLIVAALDGGWFAPMLTAMPRGPKGEKRLADVIGAAVMVARIATGEIEDTPSKAPNRAKGGKAGGRARAAKLPAAERKAIAAKASEARWGKK